MGPLLGGYGGSWCHRSAGDATGRHSDRHRQAQPQGRRSFRAQHPRPVARSDELRPRARWPGACLAHLRQSHVGLVVSPGKGQFTRTDDVETDSVLPNHSTVGTVRNLRDEIPVTAPHGGIVVEWLVENGDPVAPGQPLLRLYPNVETSEATEVTR